MHRGRLFSVCILTSRMKRASQLRSFKTCTLRAGKYSFVIKIGVVPFTCFLELNHLREACVTKHTKVPVLNIECPFYTLLLSRRWKCASVYNVPCAVVMESGSSQHIPGSCKARVIPLLPFDISSYPVYKFFFHWWAELGESLCACTHKNIYAHKIFKGGIFNYRRKAGNILLKLVAWPCY